jgi:hypothetical protein
MFPMPRVALAVAAFTLAMPWTVPATGQGRPGSPASHASSSGLIVGQVVDATTGRGVAGAVVSLAGGPVRSSRVAPPPPVPAQGPPLMPAAGSQHVLATSDGRFVFRDLAPGMYSVSARKPGYLEGAYGRRAPEGATRSIRLADGERLGGVMVPMWK